MQTAKIAIGVLITLLGLLVATNGHAGDAAIRRAGNGARILCFLQQS